ncbi:MAG: response regulator [Gemmatimonadetes bacterium]|nr:response regulator [Gemmatimonadota bacterium]
MKRILIVEDNVDLASGLRRNLEVEGHKATVAGTAAAAIETAMRESPDLLVLDLGLPDRDGYYVLEQPLARLQRARADPECARAGGRQGEGIPPGGR